MKDSLIVSFIVFICKKIFEIYNNSFLEKIIKSICEFFKKRADDSAFCKLFTNSYLDGSYWRNSIAFKILISPVRLIKIISKKCGDFLLDLEKNSEFFGIFDNLLYIPLREYGYLSGAFCAGMIAVLLIKNAMTVYALIFSAALLVISLILIALPCSPASVFGASIIIKPFKGLFNRYYVEENYEKKENILFHIKSIRYLVAMFLAAGIAAGFVSPLIALTALIAAIAVAIILHNTMVGVFITVFAAPIMPTMVCVGLVCLTAIAFVKDLLTDKDRKYILTPMDFLVTAFLLLEVFSAFTSFNAGKSIQILVINVVFTMVYFLIVNTVRTKNQWYNLILSFICAGVLVSLYGIYQNFFGGATDTSWIDEDMFTSIGTRVYSTLDNPNVLGQYLVLVVPVAFAAMWSAKKISDRVILFFAVAVTGACLIFTWSRAAWVGVIFAIGFYLLMKDRRWSTLCILALIIMPFVLPESIISRITSIGNMQDSSTAYRVSVWIASLRIAFDYLLCGIGLGTGAFERVYQNYALNGAGFALHSHNFYIQLVVEMGILALVLFILIIFSSYKQIVSIREKNTVNKNIALAIGGAFIGYLFQGMAENLWYNYRMILVFWIYLALLQSGVNVTKNEVMTLESIKE